MPSTCTTCASGYIVSTDLTSCQACPANCGSGCTYAASGATCTTCSTGYYGDGTTTCTACGNGCADCTGASGAGCSCTGGTTNILASGGTNSAI